MVLTTKKHIVDQKRLKPNKILLPHPINTSPTTTVCIIAADPQRALKDVVAHPSFPTDLATKITRVIGIAKLKTRYKSFESRRQLLAEHDVFLADSRIVTYLPNLLGKTFYKGTKRPIPVNLPLLKAQDPNTKKRIPIPKPTDGSKALDSPKAIAREIEIALSSALIHLSPAATTSVRIGISSFSAEHLAENVHTVVNGMIEKFVTNKWRNVRAVHIKGPNTMALPIWLASELWVEEEDVLEEAEARQRSEKGKQRGKRAGREIEGPEDSKHRKIEGGEEQNTSNKKRPEDEMSVEMQERRKKLRAQKREVADAAEGSAEVRKRKSRDDEDKPLVKKVKKVKKSVALSSGGDETGITIAK